MNKQMLMSVMTDQIAAQLTDVEQLIPRHSDLNSFLTRKEITVVTGVRRCGKSSLIREFIKSLAEPHRVIYLNFDDPRLLQFGAEDFETLYTGWLESNATGDEPRIAIFDEIQNVDGWERWVNFYTEQKKFKVFITGSNSKILSSELATHLTGRHIDLALYPLSFREVCNASIPTIAERIQASISLTIEERSELKKLFVEYLRVGGFPRSWTLRSAEILGDYYTDILYRDIVRRHKLRQSQFIAKFGQRIMSDVGRLINKSKFARTIDLKQVNTINSYFDFFEECFLGFEIKQFDTSIRRQMRSLTKFYAIDPVLASRVGISDESRHGFYLENFVFIELKRRGGIITYWSGNSCEVDFVIETRENHIHLIQVAWDISSSETRSRELVGFESFATTFPQLYIASRMIITVEENFRIALPEGVTSISFVEWAVRF